MVYGIISAKDSQTSLAYFKSKKISQGNLVTADRLQQLANVITAGEITFANTPAEFPRLVRKVSKYCNEAQEPVYGLENAYGYGRTLAVWLLEKGYIVKDVNTSLSHREAKHRAMFKKSDSFDARAVAIVTINMLDELPDACPNDAYWSLGQLVSRRDNIMSHIIRLKNQLHEQLCISYPSYKKFFNDVGRPTALYFWEQYPSPKHLVGKTVEELREELVPISHNRCSTKTCQNILDVIKADKAMEREYQDARDMIIRSIVRDLSHYDTQLKEMDEAIEKLYSTMGCTLTTIPGVNVTTAVKIISEIGDVKRFKNASKLAQFAAIAPLKVSSANSETVKRRKEGNRRLQATIYFLAIQMIQVSSKGVPRNPVFRAYYERRLAEGKPTKQVLICICRRLINIIYGMLKHQTEYRMPQLESEEKSTQEQG